MRRGGWTWYTGAAAWAWRLAVEEILGIRLAGGQLQLRPALPKDWSAVEVRLQRPSGEIDLTIQTDSSLGADEIRIEIDGEAWPEAEIPFPDDGSTRAVVARTPVRT